MGLDTLYEIETFKIKLAISEPTLALARSPLDVATILRPIYANLDADQEHFSILLLNNKNRVRAHKVISSGSLTASLVHPREVFKPVILYGAAAVILCHNHPSGDPATCPMRRHLWHSNVGPRDLGSRLDFFLCGSRHDARASGAGGAQPARNYRRALNEKIGESILANRRLSPFSNHGYDLDINRPVNDSSRRQTLAIL
jgi:hypothetical protein